MAYDTSAIWAAEHQQRKRILQRIISIGIGLLIIMISAILLLYGITSTTQNAFISLIGVLLTCGVAWVLIRSNYLNLATHLLFVALLISVFVSALPTGTTSRALFTLFIPIVGSALLLPHRWSYAYAAAGVGLFLTLYSVHGLQIDQPQDTFIKGLVYSSLLIGGCFGITAALAALTAQRLDHLLRMSVDQSRDVEAARADLELRVAERTTGLQQALEELQQSGETIRQLSAPILPLAEGVLVLPLIGNISQERAAFVSQQLLAEVHRRRAKTVLIDLTGIGVVDLGTSQALEQVTTAVRLLGAEPVLVGIRAAIADIITSRGINLQHVTTRRDVQSGLAYALERK
jgi:anti-anti-sigma regulatory factor